MTDRTLDLDILYYNEEIINTKDLSIPHPKIQERRFVLQILNEIAPNYLHPILLKKNSELLDICPDKLEGKIFTKKIVYNFIAIEGCIGAGKSTLTTMLSQHFNCTHQFENFEENPYLENFYKNPTNHAFPLELFFMAERYKQQKSMIESINLFNSKLISDYAFFKSLVFANITLKEDELQLFKMLYNIIYPQLKYPDIVLYLYKNIDKLQENIKKRGRNYETAITNQYLEQLNNEYLHYFKQQNNSTIVILNTNKLDFKANKEDFKLILDILNNQFNKKLNYL